MKGDFSFLSWRHKIALWFFGLFPSIRMVALCNSRAMGGYSENSDIDLFIIARSGQIWTVRFLTTAISSLLGIRRQKTHGLTKGTPAYIKKTKNKFCLSFFITEDAMDLSFIRIENDILLDTMIDTLIPLINKNNTLERCWEANSVKASSIIHSPLFIHYSLLERFVKKIWLPHTLKTYEKLGKPWGIIISDTILKFHDNDQRKIYRDKHFKE